MGWLVNFFWNKEQKELFLGFLIQKIFNFGFYFLRMNNFLFENISFF